MVDGAEDGESNFALAKICLSLCGHITMIPAVNGEGAEFSAGLLFLRGDF